MNAIATIPPAAQAEHIAKRLELLASKYRSGRENKTALEFREIAVLVRDLERDLRNSKAEK